jgi:chemotaxis protein methyltransferase CheR
MFLSINDIKNLAVKMKEALGIDYTGYALSFFRRRLTGVLEKNNIHKISDFESMLGDTEKAGKIAYDISVPCTEMFRDPAFWRSIKKLIADKNKLKVWFPISTNGYELYSFLVVVKQLGLKDVDIVVNYESDYQKEILEKRFISNKIDEINKSNFERLESSDKYEDFIVENDLGHELKRELFTGISFKKGWYMNMSADTEKYDMIIFRNHLTDYGYALHERAIRYICDRLKNGGLLAIGIKESLIVKDLNVSVINENESIYGLTTM